MNEPVIKPIFEPKGEPMSAAVFLSGSGTNFISIAEEERRLARAGGKLYGRIDAVFTNAPGSEGAKKAAEYGIPVLGVSSKKYFDFLHKSPEDEEMRDYYDAAALALVENVCSPDIIVLAGYRRRLGRVFIERYSGRILNLYPGDITKDYLVRGVDACVQALRAGEDSIRCTVYLECLGERFGAALVQSPPVSLVGFTEDDKDAMGTKIREEAEWKAFPFAVHELLAKGRAGIDKDGALYVDGIRLGPAGYAMESP
jgi:phosphoribosylglycinamide formyltransferase-1